MAVKHPTVLWAQRSQNLYISIEIEDMKVDELTINENKFVFKGKHGADQYEVDLTLYGKLKGDERRQINTKRRLEFVIPKENAEWWPRLVQDKVKIPWLKVDFDKWKDEDEDNKEDEEFNFGGMDFSNFGMPGGMGMPGMGMPGMGMPGMGMPGGGLDDLDLDDNDDGDEDMGELEDINDDEGKDNADNMVDASSGSTKPSDGK